MAIVLLAGCHNLFNLTKVELTADARGGVDADGATSDDDALGDAPPGTACGSPTGVVALYPIDGDVGLNTITDVSSNMLHGQQNEGIQGMPGPPGCGIALKIQNNVDATIASDTRFELGAGSIDLWVRPISLGSANETRVIIGHDQDGNNPGDLSLFEHRLASGDLIFVARLQSGTAETGGGTFRCSNVVLDTSTWYHVAVSFGPPELELTVNGDLQNRTGPITLNEPVICHASTSTNAADAGIDGGRLQTWRLGHGNVDVGGTSTKVYFANGGLDHLRISNQRF